MKFKSSIVAIGRFEARYAEEWVAYHLAIGFDHFYLYDNADTGEENLSFLLDKYRDKITLIAMPGKARQGAAYNHFLQNHRLETEWAAFIDFDEFFVFHEDRTVDAFLQKYQCLGTIALNWLSFGHAGHHLRPSGLIIDNYVWRFPTYLSEFKSLVRTDLLDEIRSIHNINGAARLTNGHDLQGESLLHIGEQIKYASAMDTTRCASINHYFTRSLEDIEIKAQRGSAAGTVPGARNFDWYFQAQEVFNSEIDLSAPSLVRSIIANSCSVDPRVKEFFRAHPWPAPVTPPADFDSNWYLGFYPDLSMLRAASPLEHFCSIGAHQGRVWNARRWEEQFFSPERYLELYPHLTAEGVSVDSAEYHYKVSGRYRNLSIF